MNDGSDIAISRLASAIGEPSRARMLFCLLDGHARTSTELAMVAEVSPSTASVHLTRLKKERLVKLLVQGKHRYYSIERADVARALEALMVVAGSPRSRFVPTTPEPLRHARTCYDHMAGAIAVSLLHGFMQSEWIVPSRNSDEPKSEGALDLTPNGTKALESLGIDIAATRSLRRRFAYACIDWSERKPHIGGALGAALLQMAMRRRWVERELDSRVLQITRLGQRELAARFGIEFWRESESKRAKAQN
jgi:DNA-binding transcriptional ArsR family regulator